MIGLRVAHLLGSARISAAASSALSIMRWMEQNGHDGLLLSSGGPAADDCRAEGLELLLYQPGSGPFWWLKKRGELMRGIGDWQPDLLHVHRLDELRLGLDIARKLHLPILVSVHRPVSAEDAKGLRNPEVAFVLVPSEAQRAHYAGRLGLNRDRVAVLPYGIDSSLFVGEREEGPVGCIGAIGNFDEDASGFGDLVEALAALRRDGREFRGLLVGSGSGRQALEERIGALRLGDVMSIEASSSRTAPLLERMDIFVYPVRQDSHYLGLIKAMAAGCAVVASAICGTPEVIRNGETGLLVPPGDVAALAEALRGLFDDPARAHRLGRQARQLAEQQHGLDRMGEIVHELYRAALRGTGGSSGTEVVTTHRRHNSQLGKGG